MLINTYKDINVNNKQTKSRQRQSQNKFIIIEGPDWQRWKNDFDKWNKELF